MKSEDLQERLEESEKLMNDMSKTWEQKLQETEQIHKVGVTACCWGLGDRLKAFS